MVVAKDRWAMLNAAADRRGVAPSVLLLAAYCEVQRTGSKKQEFTVTVTSRSRLTAKGRRERVLTRPPSHRDPAQTIVRHRQPFDRALDDTHPTGGQPCLLRARSGQRVRLHGESAQPGKPALMA
jgi:hypothetical protein